VTPTTPNRPKPPTHLSAASRAWWTSVVADWSGLEEHHVRLLTLAAEALDRGDAARRTIAKEGAIYRDRFGAPRRHPAAAIAAEGAATFARLVRQLGLDAAEPGPPRNQWRRPKAGR
jgi:P27 family predicted phage terminase small subunit